MSCPESSPDKMNDIDMNELPSDNIPFWPISPAKDYRGLSTKDACASETSEAPSVNIDVGVDLVQVIRGAFRTSSTTKQFIEQDIRAVRNENWEYPGWGQVIERSVPTSSLPEKKKSHQLNIYQSTAIAGNDLLASVLYTTGIVCTTCGQLAPIAVILVCIALYPFRKIFQECGTALPLNGGVYVALLNSASKFTATFAASCSLIDYLGTAVVSAAACTSYAQAEFGSFPVMPVTVAILAVFGILVLSGVRDSATVALIIFTFHLFTLAILVIAALIAVIANGGSVFLLNLYYPGPISPYGRGMDLFLGFSVGLLGITGFETSANYIEEAGPFETEKNKIGPVRQTSVFERTISNMWWLVVLINPVITILTLGVLDIATIIASSSTILSTLGQVAGGSWLRTLVSVDAIVVLAGGVLTAYVGVTGLIRQLASDRCLPSFLLHKNEFFGTNHWIIFCFFSLSTVLYCMTNGDVTVLSGVFAIAFLMVLISFALANMKLKFCRPRLPRGVTASWISTILGFMVMVLGLLGNIFVNPSYVYFFGIYLFFFLTVILITFSRMKIVKLILYFVQQSAWLENRIGPVLYDTLVKMKKLTVVFFANTSEVHILNKAILYARDNELCDRLIIAHVFDPQLAGTSELRKRLKENLYILDHVYPKMKVDLLMIEADEFTPALVRYLSEELHIQPSFMFIRCPSDAFPCNIGEFEGVRTIMR